MPSARVETLQRLVDVWNSGDVDGFLEAIGPEVEFSPDPSFPDAGTYRGEELRRWIREWAATWEGNRLEVLEWDEHGNAVTMLCRWHLAPREGHDEVPVNEFTIVWVFGGDDPNRPTQWMAFFDRERALEAARTGLG